MEKKCPKCGSAKVDGMKVVGSTIKKKNSKTSTETAVETSLSDVSPATYRCLDCKHAWEEAC